MTSPPSSETTTCTYRFLSSLDDHVPPTIPHILIRQQPQQAKQSIAYDRERRPVEPPPIVQITFSNLSAQETMTCLQSPYYFMTARLVTPDSRLGQPMLCDNEEDVLTGSVVSSLHRLKDIDNQDAGFFVFGDLAIKIPGVFKIHFSLFEIRSGQVINRETIATEPFTVYSPKQFPGPLESTFLSRTFADQGVRMRIRKEHRMHSKVVPSKRKTTGADDSADKSASRKPSSSRLRNHSVRFVSQNSMYGGSNSSKATPRRHAAAGPAASSITDHQDEAKDYHVGKFRFEREESRQPSNSPPIELLALYAERAAKELALPKLAGYPSPPPHYPLVKTERHRKSIPSPL
ncbi:velvet factor-domain-containing protein [Umbelopsis sp. PMI_123]|nr:velvet factor-domain-containing protein [Umbelopsis sp. PMI_123]